MSARHLRNKPEDEDAAQLKFGPEFSGVTLDSCLSPSEVKLLLETMPGRVGSENPIYKKTVDYATEFARFHDGETVGSVRQSLASVTGITQFEIVQIMTLLPTSVEEARALVPSLSNRDETQLEEALREVVQTKQLQG